MVLRGAGLSGRGADRGEFPRRPDDDVERPRAQRIDHTPRAADEDANADDRGLHLDKRAQMYGQDRLIYAVTFGANHA